MQRMGLGADDTNFIKVKYREVDEKITVTELMVLSQNFETLILYKEGTYQFVYKIFKTTAVSESENTIENFGTWCKIPSKLAKRKIFKKLEEDDFFIGRSGSIRKNLRYTLQDIFSHISEEMTRKLQDDALQYRWRPYTFSILLESFFPAVKWIAPIRAEPKRIYEHKEIKESIDGSHAPQALRDILNSSSKVTSKFKEFINKFGQKSHLFDEIKVKKFGTEKFAPFEVQVYLEGKPYSISNVGYGVSQVLPLLLEIFDETNQCIAIQQPEVHLHPIAQAEFGELLFNSASETDKVFFIETHSDFTLDRFRFCISNGKTNFQSQLLFFHRRNKLNTVEMIPISEQGSYWETASTEFRQFFINESIKLLGI
jgi:hypothetical protein